MIPFYYGDSPESPPYQGGTTGGCYFLRNSRYGYFLSLPNLSLENEYCGLIRIDLNQYTLLPPHPEIFIEKCNVLFLSLLLSDFFYHFGPSHIRLTWAYKFACACSADR